MAEPIGGNFIAGGSESIFVRNELIAESCMKQQEVEIAAVRVMLQFTNKNLLLSQCLIPLLISQQPFLLHMKNEF